MTRSKLGDSSPSLQPPQRAGWIHPLRLAGFLLAGLTLQHAVSVGSSFLVHQQGIHPSDDRIAGANWVLERFVHNPRSGASIVRAWPRDTRAADRPELRADPMWNPLEPSVWVEQPGFAAVLSGIPVSLVQCFEGGGFLGETWVAFAPIELRDPNEDLSSQHDAPTVETVIEWWMQEWRAPRTRSIHDNDILDARVGRLRPFDSGPSEQGYLFELDYDDCQKSAWVQHLLDTSTLRVTPPRWFGLQGLLARAAADTDESMRPLGLMSRAWGFPFRSVIERAELQRRPLRFVEGGVDGWYAPDWEVMSYDGVRFWLSSPLRESVSSVGVAIRPLWTGALLNSVIYAIALWCVWRALGPLRAVPRMLRARRGQCRACGHPLAGLARCPECGQA